LLINGVKADYKLLDTASETIGNGTTLPVLHLTERLGNEQRTIQWMPDLSRAADFGPVTVPAEHYLMLGDNRDNSADSRYIGFIPRTALIARAERILVSADILDNWMPRAERFGKSLY
jgi:signal peptidase I